MSAINTIGQSKDFSYPNVPETVQPRWLNIKNFEGNTSLTEKVERVGNLAVGSTCLLSLFNSVSPRGTALAYASYLAWGLAGRKIASTILGYLVYPAAFTSFPYCGKEILQKRGKRQIDELQKDGFTVRKITIQKSGTKYDALLITHFDTMKNGTWSLHAKGNAMAMEDVISATARENFANKCNTLLINGPSVSESGGWPTRYQMGAGFEAGLQLLEKEVKATHIIMRGLSLGGGMLAEAVLQHDFTEGLKNDIRYLSISDRTFSKLSSAASEIVGKIVKPIFVCTGTELDGIEAAKKLSALNIRQIIVQHVSNDGTGSDSVIPDNVSLANELHQNYNELTDKVFLESRFIEHNESLPDEIKQQLNDQIHLFTQDS